MRKQKIILLFVILLFAGNLLAQSGWMQIATYSPLRFSSCQYTSNETAYLAGGFNMLLKTTNNGVTWIRKKADNFPSASFGVIKFDFKSSNVGYLIASYSGIVKTEDGGDKFTQIYTGTPETMLFINETTGFVTDIYTKKLLKTINGGTNWITVLDTCNILPVFFLNETTGLGVHKTTYKTVRTTNGGANWSEVLTGSVDFCSAAPDGNLIATIGNAIWKSTNAGLNWSTVYHHDYSLQNVYVINNNKIIIKAGSLSFLVSTNGGANWQLKNSPTTTPYVNVSFNSLGEGMFANTDGDILKITPDLNSVTSLIADSIRTVSDLEIAGNSKVYLIGDIRTISSSTNNGTTFTKKSLPFNLTSISFVNQNTGYGVFYNVLLKTNNAASSWDTVYKTSDGSFLRNINFLNDNTGFMYKSYYTGEYSTDTLCFTTNGGTNWTSTKISNYIRSFYEYEEYKTFYNLQLFANGTGYFNYSYSLRSQTNDSLYVGYYRTTNFGQTFQLVTLDSLMFPINFINENTGFGRIANYSLYKTTDKGTSWTRTGRIPNYLFENFVRKVLFVNSNTGFVLTSFRTLMIIGKTTDGGATWSDKRFDLENASATDMKFYGEQLGFIYGGETGQIFRTTDGGSTFVVQTTSEITSVFLLSQNYPNPFNPSTRINYELKITNFVTLKVFDLLGKEVASLVNEKQNAGSYVVDFKSAEYNLPSGIYFYTLNAGDFKETRKMVLIK